MKIFFSILFLLIFSSCTKKWNYDESSGPKAWGDIDEKFKFCKIGYNQSPIDIKNSADFEFKDNELKFFYGTSDVEKERKNFVTQIIFDGADSMLRGKKKYFLKRLEFHHPSEHLIDSKPHSLELQIYHKSDDEQWLVLSIFLEIGKENSDFKDLISILLQDKKDSKLSLKKIVKADDKSFFYDGSFTTPPCKEGVKWYVMKTVLELSKEQMNQIIKTAIFAKSNARPVQQFHPEKF